jgi:putative FmdB family regulatory protein
MPTLYEYRCMSCRTLFEERRPVARCNEPATCPQCGMPGRRVYSPPLRVGVPVTMTPEQIRRSEEVWE